MIGPSKRIVWMFVIFELLVGAGIYLWWTQIKFDDRVTEEDRFVEEVRAHVMVNQDAYFAQSGAYAGYLSELGFDVINDPVRITIYKASKSGYTILVRDGIRDRDIKIVRLHMTDEFIEQARASAPPELVAITDSIAHADSIRRAFEIQISEADTSDRSP